MKRLLCILCAALLLCACTAGNPVPAHTSAEPTEQPTAAPTQLVYVPIPEITGYASFSDALAAKLLDGTQNHNLSPISVYLALAMVTEGANGETLDELLRLLGCDSIEELRGVCGAMLEELSIDTETSALAVADSIWMADREGLTFSEDYLKALADIYRSEAHAVQFGTADAAKQIADWITERTRGKIQLPSMDFDPETTAVLINTIYLKDQWSTPFNEDNTEDGTFFGPDGEQTVHYMIRTDHGVEIVKGDGFLRYSLPLLRVGRMTFVLPDEGVNLSDLLGSTERLHALLTGGNAIKANVSIKLPKFQFEDQIDLNEILKSLGIGRAFTAAADFSGISNIPTAISDVMQGSFVGVDENGVEAAAYTMLAMGATMFDTTVYPDMDFHLTRPFLYTIERYDGTVLFIGTVTAPTPVE